MAHSSSHKHNMVPPPSRPFLSLWDRCLLMSTSQLDGYLHLSFPHSPNEHCPQQPDSHCTSGSTYMVKKSHPIYSPTIWSGNYGWDRYGNRTNCFINHLHALSKDFTDNIERVVKSLVALQDQLDSLIEGILQNRKGLDLLTAEREDSASS